MTCKNIKKILLFSLTALTLFVSCTEENNRNDTIEVSNSFKASQAVASNLWGNNERMAKRTVNLHVLLMNGSLENQDLIKEIAPSWSEYGNVDFIFSNDPKSRFKFDIVVEIFEESSGKKQGGLSHLGTNSKKFSSKTESSMKLWLTSRDSYKEKKRRILHEFGHALGLSHEHQHPDRTFKYKEEKVLKQCKKQKWTITECRDFRLNKFNAMEHTIFPYDINSIMHYHIHKKYLKDKHASIKSAYELSPLDQRAIAQLYPGRMIIDEEETILVETEAIVLETNNVDSEKIFAKEMFSYGEVRNCEISENSKDGVDYYFYKRKDMSWSNVSLKKLYTDKLELIHDMIKDQNCF